MLISTRPIDEAEPLVAAMLDAYFAERSLGWSGEGDYVPKPATFAPAGVLLLAYEGESALGIGGIRLVPAPNGVWFEVKHLYVPEAARGRGVGRTLLAALEQEAQARAATALVLDTNTTQRAAAALYERAGYTRVAPFNDNRNANAWYRKDLA